MERQLSLSEKYSPESVGSEPCLISKCKCSFPNGLILKKEHQKREWDIEAPLKILSELIGRGIGR